MKTHRKLRNSIPNIYYLHKKIYLSIYLRTLISSNNSSGIAYELHSFLAQNNLLFSKSLNFEFDMNVSHESHETKRRDGEWKS